MVELSEVAVELLAAEDEARFGAVMQSHHYLGALPGIGERLRYVAHHRGRWLALAVFSAPALKCAARDRWIGWDYRVQFDRLHLVTNNSRFLILPGAPQNLGSRVLSLCTRRLARDWPERFGHALLLVETFVDPARFHGTVYRAANWIEVGLTRGFRRQRRGYSYAPHALPKRVFVHALSRTARARLCAPQLQPHLQHGVPRMMLSAARMRSLPEFFGGIDDPRRRQGRRHALPTVLALAAAATLCGMRGYKAISEWVHDLGPKALERFRVRRRHGRYRPPSLSSIRNVLMAVDPAQLDAALRAWHNAHGRGDSALAIDGKTLRGAIDHQGNRTHVLGIVGHDSKAPWGQKKIGLKPGAQDKRTNEIGAVIPLLDTLPDIHGRTITADALHTQRALASYLLGRGAHYLFTVKRNQPSLLQDIRLTLAPAIARRPPDFASESPKPEHGRRERRAIRVSSELNHYLDFPGVGQVFAIQRETLEVKSGKRRLETVYGITSLYPQNASPQRLLTLNRQHWQIEALHHILDWSFDEDRCRIRSGHGPDNMTCLRRFAIGLICRRGLPVPQTMRNLARNPRRVLDFLKMTANSSHMPAPA